MKITTYSGITIIDNSNVISNFYLLPINESATEAIYSVQVSSVTESAAGSAIGPESAPMPLFIETKSKCQILVCMRTKCNLLMKI